MTLSTFFGLISLIIGLIGYYVYIKAMVKGQNQPHLFSWLIWAIISAIIFVAQFTNHSGAGSWAAGITTLGCLSICLLSLKYGEKKITRTDLATLIFALCIIIIWQLTQNALYAVLLAGLIDFTAYLPTFRKCWHKPYNENVMGHAIGIGKFIFALAAVEHYSTITLFNPIVVVVMNIVLISFVLIRRKMLTHQAAMSKTITSASSA
jgi:hypothetical protein